ncbi:ADP-ribose pyrophosphatase [Aquimixticola soesokkakensis]|uniref:ADP-ribose pyrophosphatase n=1 Tax=Aquimixticola soesokkakensis TaxID=1519096 RepID=A0A1Y5SK71_9RHOB|nr:NUDIX domain-containing protein [Aquimixticola soesokkakensis]SLN42051.1 ADP-ribose pyrophosphatase [Aquimixticola soesokkakensis]
MALKEMLRGALRAGGLAPDRCEAALAYLCAVIGPDTRLELMRAAVPELMLCFDTLTVEQARAQLPKILLRAQCRLHAGQNRPSRWSQAQGRDTIDVAVARMPYNAFFAVREDDLTHPRFDGTRSALINRAAFMMGDAVSVMPYDPLRDRVLLVEQFRFAPYARGDAFPWVIEPVAGRIDLGETPEEAARRECVEEAGLALQELVACGQFYPSPGGVSEFMYSFVACVALPDDLAGFGGLESEDEDIRTLLLSFDALMEMVDTGAVQNGVLLASALWLARHRDRLRRAV